MKNGHILCGVSLVLSALTLAVLASTRHELAVTMMVPASGVAAAVVTYEILTRRKTHGRT